MISFKHAYSSEAAIILDLLGKCSNKKQQNIHRELQLAKLSAFLFGPQAYHKVIVGKNDEEPFALCVYHYKTDLVMLRQGIHVDFMYVSSEYANIGAQECILQVLSQKVELEGLSFLEMEETSECQIPKSLSLSAYAKSDIFTRFRVDDRLHKFSESLSKCSNCR